MKFLLIKSVLFSRKKFKKVISIFLLFFWGLFSWPYFDFGQFHFPPTKTASAAEAVINSAAFDITMQYSSSPATVFTTSLIGYHFYVDSAGDVVYSKTTDGGANWNAAVAIDGSSPAVAWTTVAVWYDQWTPGDSSGTKIYIAAVNPTDGDDDLYFHYLDTSDDSIRSGGWVAAISGTQYDNGADGNVTITKATDGDLFVAASGNFGGNATRVYRSADAGDSWANTSLTLTSGLDDLDTQQLLPLSNGDVLIIVCDATVNKLVSKEYSSSWTNELNIDTAFYDNTSYDDNFGASLYKTTGDIYLTSANYIGNTANDLKFYKFTESSRTWETKTDILTNSVYALNVRPIIDQNNGDIYAAYIYGVIGSDTDIYYKKSDDGGTSWTAQSEKINTTIDDYRTIGTNFMNYSGDILYAVWYNDDTNAISGSSMAKDIVTSPLPNASQIDITILDATDENNPSPAMVFTDADTGYVFYVDASTNDVSYSKTSDGGETWGTAVTMGTTPAVNWANVSVWYDQWTPGDTTGTKIHIAAVDDTTGTEDVYYNYLDTNGDSIGASGWQTVINTTAWTVGTSAAPSITKATDGDIFISGAGTIDGANKIVVYRCTGYPVSCADTTLSAASGLANGDFNQLIPLSSADIMVIIQDVSANKMISIEYDDVGSSWGNELSIDTAITTNTTYDGPWGASIYKSTNDVYVVANNAINNANGDIELYKFVDSSRTSWTPVSEVVSNYQYMTQANIAIDQNTGDLYVTYVKGGTLAATTDVYFKVSLDGGSNWGNEAQLNTITDDIRYVRTNFMNPDRVAAVWYNDDLNDIVMNTMGIAKFGQAAYRWFANNNSLTVGSSLASQDTVATLPSIGAQFRLRLLLNADTSVVPTDTHHLKLQYAVKSGTCDTSFTGESYVDIATDSGDIRFYDNNDGSAVNEASMVNSSDDPKDGTKTIIRQNYYESNPFSNIRETIFRGRDGKWDFSLVDYSASANTSYCFRVVRNNGNALNSYTVIPEITTASPAISISLSTDGSVSFGDLSLSETQNTTAGGINDVETVYVDSGPVDLDIRSTSFTEGENTWTLNTVNGSDQVQWAFSSDGSDWTIFEVADNLYALATNVAESGTQDVYLRIVMPTDTSSYDQYGTTVTIVASDP